ncbi:MAG: T9SS type A sorting domain-containing protein [Bacteroidales bacterium]|nr:T9SS type A sorting domain-containing protein [Bacteroidales bacterium]
MKNAILLIVLILNLSFIQAQDSTRVLFIGNSITYVNSMPQTFENIANSLGDLTIITMYAMSGTGFADHVADPKVYDLFRKGNWDFIVLQPGSYECSGDTYPIEQTLARARILVDSLYRYNPCAQILYYQVPWGVLGDTRDDLITYNNSMDGIQRNMEYLSDSTELFFAPVGEAFRASYSGDQSDFLWADYVDLHPNAKGSYLAACVFYSSIFQKPSSGSPELGPLLANEAEDCQEQSDKIVLNHLSDWRIGTYSQPSDFNYTINSDTIFFSNLSHNVDSVLWDFGDGTSSKALNPVHVYAPSETYNVILTRYFHGCSPIIEKEITLFALGFEVLRTKIDVKIYPNPTNQILHIELKTKTDQYFVEIYDLTGSLLLKTNKLRIDISKFPPGIYFLKIFEGRKEIFDPIKWVKN